MSFINEKENLEKLHFIFDQNSSDGSTLSKKEMHRVFNEIGLSSDLFMSDLYFYFPQIKHQSASLTFDQMFQFLDYLLLNKKYDTKKIEAFKTFDRSGVGQISTAQLLMVLKKRLSQKEYEVYQKLISSSYGPLINYMQIFKKGKYK